MDNNTTPNPAPAPTPTPTPAPAPTPTPTPGTEPPKKKSNAGLIVAIVLIAIFVVVVLPCIFIFLIFFGAFKVVDSVGSEIVDQIGQEIERTETNYVAGKWNCASGTGSKDDRENFSTTLELNEDMTFRYGPYGDLKNNHFSGTYTFEDEEKKNNTGDYSYYMVKFETKEFIVDGAAGEEDKKLSEMEMGITKTADGKQAITIFTSSYNMYYCYDY